MKTLRPLVLGLALAASATPLWSAAASTGKVTSDLAVPAKRQETVDKATYLARTPTPATVPADLNNPFNPAGFDAPDPDDARPTTPGQRPGPAQPSGPTSDRDLLEAMAPRIQPTGRFTIGGKPLLTFGTKRVYVGTSIEVTYNEKVYELEVVAIENTNFTLRYRGEEITRPIAKTTK